MKQIRSVALRLTLLMSLLSVMSSTSLAREEVQPERRVAQTCESLLDECADVVKKQEEALRAVDKEREVREAIIEGQEKQIKELKAERKVAVTTSTLSLGALLLILLL